MLYGVTPNLGDLRTIGCLCYAANVGELDKFKTRAHQCVHLGYTFGFKGYKLYDLTTKKVFHSRDVIFQERVFPFEHQHQSLPTDHLVPSLFWPHSEPPVASPRQSVLPSVSIPHSHDTAPTPTTTAPDAPLLVPDSYMPSSDSTADRQALNQVDIVLPDPSDQRTVVEPHPPPLWRSARSKVTPTWLKDFVQPRATPVQNTSPSHSHSFQTTTTYPLLHDADLSYLSQAFVASFMSVLQVSEPHTYSQAKTSPEWLAAMDKELEALEANGTCLL